LNDSVVNKEVNNTFSYNDINNSSFRVENRKAKPKIIKNVNNVTNIFIIQN